MRDGLPFYLLPRPGSALIFTSLGLTIKKAYTDLAFHLFAEHPGRQNLKSEATRTIFVRTSALLKSNSNNYKERMMLMNVVHVHIKHTGVA